MRFSEIFDASNGITIASMSESQFKSAVNTWAHKMGKRVGYRKKTRMEHWQEAIDTVYSAIEVELNTTNPSTIQKDPKWEALMLAAYINFPEHINVYHPTLVEQQRTQKLVENSKVTRHLRNKLQLLKFLKEDKDLGVKDISALAVSRLQCEVLATSAEVLVSNYKGGALNKATATRSAKAEGTATPNTSKSINDLSLGGKATASATIQAGYDSGKVNIGHNWSHSLQASVKAKAGVEGYADANAKLKDLELSANAGLGAEMQVTSNIDYAIEHSCKVKASYLRRILGPQFKTVEMRLGGSTSAGLKGNIKGSASVFGMVDLDLAKESAHMKESNPYIESQNSAEVQGVQSFKDKHTFSVVDVHADADVEIAVRMEGHAGITVGQTIALDVSGDLFAGACASGNVKFLINEREVGMDIGGKAMAGFEMGTSQKLSLKHPSRNVNIFTVHARESLTAGIGVEGKISGRISLDHIYLDTTAGMTVGVGTSFTTKGVFNPRSALLVGYDLLVAPTILRLGQEMQKHHSGQHTQRMTRICDYLNKQASKGEINQVYTDNVGRIAVCIATMTADAERLYKMTKIDFRTSSMSYAAMSDSDIIAGVKGTSQSAYHSYTTEATKTNILSRVFGSKAGDSSGGLITSPVITGATDMGKTITQEFVSSSQVKGAKLDAAITGDKEALHTVTAAYNKAKTGGNGECIAYKVLRKDMLEGTAISYE